MLMTTSLLMGSADVCADDALYALPAYGAGVPGKKCTENNFFSESGLSALDWCACPSTWPAYVLDIESGMQRISVSHDFISRLHCPMWGFQAPRAPG